jgi:hypothetical protein
VPDVEDADVLNRLSAWWLGLAPSRQEEVLAGNEAAPAWLAASLEEAGLTGDDPSLRGFLASKRAERDSISQDAGREPDGPPR